MKCEPKTTTDELTDAKPKYNQLKIISNLVYNHSNYLTSL